MLNHPLVFSMFHTDQMNAWANEQYRRKLDAVAQADAACDYHSDIGCMSHRTASKLSNGSRPACAVLISGTWCQQSGRTATTSGSTARHGGICG